MDPDAAAGCWLDGRRIGPDEATLPLDDPAVQRGLGLFETIAIRDGALLDLEEHLDRLYNGLERLAIATAPRERLRATALTALEGAASCGWLKIIVTGAGRDIVFRGAMDPADEGREVSAVLLPWRRNPSSPLAGLKTLSYAANLLGLAHARGRGADEGLWLNTRGHLAEGCSSNLFVIRGGSLFTPAERDGILPGVLRGLVLSAARKLGRPVHEGKLRLPRLLTAHEAFLTSSLRGLMPLTSYEGRPLAGGRCGPLTRRLAALVAGARQATPAAPLTAPVRGDSGPA